MDSTVVLISARGPLLQGAEGRVRGILLIHRPGPERWIQLETHPGLELKVPATDRKMYLNTTATLEVRQS